MTRKHYVAVATCLRVLRQYAWSHKIESTCEIMRVENAISDLADFLKGDNPNFNRGKFMEAVKSQEFDIL